MKRLPLPSLGAALAILLVFAHVALAADSKSGEPKSVEAKIQGTNYCLACALGEAGGNSSCSALGHRHALKVERAEDSSGKRIRGLKGKTVHYLYNAKGKEFVEGHHGEKLTVRGKLFVDERVIDIHAAEIDVAKVEPSKESADAVISILGLTCPT